MDLPICNVNTTQEHVDLPHHIWHPTWRMSWKLWKGIVDNYSVVNDSYVIYLHNEHRSWLAWEWDAFATHFGMWKCGMKVKYYQHNAHVNGRLETHPSYKNTQWNVFMLNCHHNWKMSAFCRLKDAPCSIAKTNYCWCRKCIDKKSTHDFLVFTFVLGICCEVHVYSSC